MSLKKLIVSLVAPVVVGLFYGPCMYSIYL